MKLLKITGCSLLSSLLGCLIFLIGMLIATYEEEIAITFESLSTLASIYLFTAINGAFLVFILATPLYFLFYKFKAANYLTSAVAGGAFTLLTIKFESAWIALALSGFIVGPIFHYYSSSNKVLSWVKI